MSVAIFMLSSSLHNEEAVVRTTREYLNSLDVEYAFHGSDFKQYGESALNLIYVSTGGTEAAFLRLLPRLLESESPIYLLTSGKSNSLAASAEILSYLRQHNVKGEILHGSAEYVSRRIHLLEKTETARKWLRNARLGVMGRPSDWLISSGVDYETVRQRLGVALVDIPMEEVKAELDRQPEPDAGKLAELSSHIAPLSADDTPGIEHSMAGALQMYTALKAIVKHHDLQGFTIRCFDLLTAVQNTGCTALALLNAEGYVAGCEGDIPTALSMLTARSLLGISGFQANPAHINPETGEMLFAHCTIPLDMVDRFELDTHFESGIGIGIRGYMQTGPVTIFKLAGDLSRLFVAEGELIACQGKPDLCRTQQQIRLADPSDTNYFLSNPIGNHHVILPGHHKELIEAMFLSE